MTSQTEAEGGAPAPQRAGGGSKSRTGHGMQVPSESMVQRAIRAFNESSSSFHGSSPLKRGGSPLAGTGNLAHPHEPRLRSAPPGKHKGPQTQASSPHTYVPGSQLSSHYHSAIHGNVLDASPGRRSTATDDGQFISPTRSRSLSATSSQISSHANGAAVTASSLASSAVPGTPVAASRSSRSPKAAFTGRVLGCVPVCGAPSGAGTHSQAVPGEGSQDVHMETMGTSASIAADSAALDAVRPPKQKPPLRPGVLDRATGHSGASTRGLSDENLSSSSITRDVAASALSISDDGSALWNRETLDSAWEDLLARRRAGIVRSSSADHLCLEDVECAVRESFMNCSGASSELGDFAGGDSAIAVEKTMAHLRHLVYTLAQSAPGEPPKDINSPAAFAAALHHRLRHNPPTHLPSPRAHSVAIAAARSLSPNDYNSMPLQRTPRPQGARVQKGPQTSPTLVDEQSEAQSTPRTPRSPPPRPFLVPVTENLRHQKQDANAHANAANPKAPQQRQQDQVQVPERRPVSKSPVQVQMRPTPREPKEPKEAPPTSPPLPSRSTRRRAQEKARAVAAAAAAAAAAEEAAAPAASKGNQHSPSTHKQHSPHPPSTSHSSARSESKPAAATMSSNILSSRDSMSATSRRTTSPPPRPPSTRAPQATPSTPKSIQCPSSGGQSNIQAGPDAPHYWSPNAVPSVGSNAILLPAPLPKQRTPTAGRYAASSLSPRRTSTTPRAGNLSPVSGQHSLSPRRVNPEAASPARRRAALRDAFNAAAHTPFHASRPGGSPHVHASRRSSMSRKASSVCDVDLSPVASAMMAGEFQSDNPAWETRFYNSSYALPGGREESVVSSEGSHHVRQPRNLRPSSVCSSISHMNSHCDSRGRVSSLSDDFHEAENELMNGASGRHGSSVFNTQNSLCSITAAVRLSPPNSNRTLSPSSTPPAVSGSMSNTPSVSFNFTRTSHVVPSSRASVASVGEASDMHVHSTRREISASLSESTSATTTPRLQSKRPHSAHSIRSTTELSYPTPQGPNSISSLDLTRDSSLNPVPAAMHVRETLSEATMGQVGSGRAVSPRPPLAPSGGGVRSPSAPTRGQRSHSDRRVEKSVTTSESGPGSAAAYYNTHTHDQLPESSTSATPATMRSDTSAGESSNEPYFQVASTKAPQSVASTANTVYGSHPTPVHSVSSTHQPQSYGSTPSQHVHSTLDSGGEPLRVVVSSEAPYEQEGDENIRISALDFNTPLSPTTQRLLSSPRLTDQPDRPPTSLSGVSAELARHSHSAGLSLGGGSGAHGEGSKDEKFEDPDVRMSAFAGASGPRSDITVGSRHRGGLGGLECGSSLTSSVPSLLSPLSPQTSLGPQEGSSQTAQRIPRAPPAVPIRRHQYINNPPDRSSLTPRCSTTARSTFQPRSPRSSRSQTPPLPQATASASAVTDFRSPPWGSGTSHRSSVGNSPVSPKFHTAARARSRVQSATAPMGRPGKGRPGAGLSQSQSPGVGSKPPPAGLNPRLFAPTESFARKVATGGSVPRSRVVSDSGSKITTAARNINVGAAATGAPQSPRGTAPVLLTKSSFARRKGLNSKFGSAASSRNAAGAAAEQDSNDAGFFSVAELVKPRRGPTKPRISKNGNDMEGDSARIADSSGTVSQDFRPSEYHEIDRDQELDRLMNEHMHENMHETLRSPNYDPEAAAAAATALEAANMHKLAALSTAATTLSPTFPDRVFGSTSEHPAHVDAKAFDRKNLFHGADDANTVDPLAPQPSTDEHIKQGDAGTPPIREHTRIAAHGPTSASSAKLNWHESPSSGAQGSANMSFSAAVRDQIAQHRRQSRGSPHPRSRSPGGRVPGVDIDTSFSPSMSYDDTDLDDLSQTSSVMYWDSQNGNVNGIRNRSASASRRSRRSSRGPTSAATASGFPDQPASESAEPPYGGPQVRGDSAAETADAPAVVDCGGGQIQSQLSGGSMEAVSGPCAEPAGHSSAWNSASLGGGPAVRPTDSLMSARGHSGSTSKHAKDFTFGVPLSPFRRPTAAARSQSIDEAQTVEWWANANGNSAGDASKATVASVEPPAAAYGRVDPIRRQLMEQASSQGRAYMVAHHSGSLASVSGLSSKGQSSRLGGPGTVAPTSANVQDAPYSGYSGVNTKGTDSKPVFAKERSGNVLTLQIQDPQDTPGYRPLPGNTFVPTDTLPRPSWWRRRLSCMLCQAMQ